LSALSLSAAVDSFEGYMPGQVDAVTANWKAMPTGYASAVIEVDPDDPGNKTLQVSTSSDGLQGNGVYGILPAAAQVPNNTTKTLFLRFQASATTTNQSFGLTDVDAPSAGGGGNWVDFRVQVGVIDGDLRARDADAMRTLMPVTPGTWYNLWIVVNNATDTFSVYLNQGDADAEETDRLASVMEGIDTFAFRSGTTESLDRFLWRAQPRTVNSPIRIDDLHLMDGVSLENPPAALGDGALSPDINRDQFVDVVDLLELAKAWLVDCIEPQWCGRADIDRSGRVDLVDFAHISREWISSTIEGLTAWWPLDESIGNIAYDVIGQQHGMLYYTEQNDRVPSGAGYVLGLDGVAESDGLGEYLRLPCVARNDFSIAFWMRTNQFASAGEQWWHGKGLIDAIATGVRNDFGISLLRDKAAFGVNGPATGDVTIQSATAINDGYWHHITAARDSTTGVMKLYVDGVLEAVGTGAAGTLTGPSRMLVGSINLLSGKYLRGYFDDIRVYDRVLTTEEIVLLTQKEFPPVSPKKGVGSKTLYKINNLNVCWFYNWGVTRPPSPSGVDSGLDYVPMKWGKDWTYINNIANVGEVHYLLGFNEPDLTSQANMTVAEAIGQWPQIQAIADDYDLLLGSPAIAHYSGQWLQDFMATVDAPGSGLRVDFIAVHWYSAPNANLLMDNLTWVRNKWGRDVWLTEFNVAKWDGPNPFTQEQSYTFLAEVLHRMEKTEWIKRYALFPWDGTTENSKASPIFVAGTEVLTPLGRLYASWDGDVRGPQPNIPYFVNNKVSHRRLCGNGDNLEPATIWTMDNTAQWELVIADSSRHFLRNRANGKRLAFNNTSNQLWLADPSYTGTDARWTLIESEHGWYFVGHPDSNKRLSHSAGTWVMVPQTTVSDSERWRFIKP
jgi:hypothetical protein